MKAATLIWLALAGVLVGCDRVPGTPQFKARLAEEVSQKENAANAALIQRGEEAAAHDLFDPESARFREVILHLPAKGELDVFLNGALQKIAIKRAVCGELNGKNRQGAYVGYARFIASPDAQLYELQPVSETDENGVSNEFEKMLFSAQWTRNCVN